MKNEKNVKNVNGVLGGVVLIHELTGNIPIFLGLGLMNGRSSIKHGY